MNTTKLKVELNFQEGNCETSCICVCVCVCFGIC